MKEVTDLLAYGWPTLLAGSGFLVAARYLLIEVRNKRATNDRRGDSPLLTSINESLKSVEGVTKSIEAITREIVDANAQILAQANDIDETEDDIKQELQRVFSLVSDIADIIKNPASPASNVRIMEKLDKVVEIEQRIEVQLAGIK